MTQDFNIKDRLDRLEKIVESNAKAIQSLTLQQTEFSQEDRERSKALDDKLDRLANIVLRIANRQDDHEDRITRIEQD
jgi:hypothetical protein